jgi:DNA-3-methyladenine glycosylase II
MARATTVLRATPPFRLDLTAWALRRREKNAVDRWDDGHYSRVIVVDSDLVQLTVTQDTAGLEPTLVVAVESTTRISARVRKEAGLLVQGMLGLAVDLQPFYKLARDNAVIGPLVERFAGVRPPRFPTVFEGLVNSIACQQVSLDLGILLLNRLSERFGAQFVARRTVLYAFPTPADLAKVPEESIRELGFSRQKARAIQELAAHVAYGSVDLTSLEGMTNREAITYLSRNSRHRPVVCGVCAVARVGQAGHLSGRRHRGAKQPAAPVSPCRQAGLRRDSTLDLAMASIRRRCLFPPAAREVARERLRMSHGE